MPVVPELWLTFNDCEALDAGARTGPAATKTDVAITTQEVERQADACLFTMPCCPSVLM